MPLINARNIQFDSETLQQVGDALGVKFADSTLIKSAGGVQVNPELQLDSLEVNDFFLLNVDTAEETAIFQINSTTQGVLIPRMTEAQRDAIADPPEGLWIYNLTSHSFNWFNDTEWVEGGAAGIILSVNSTETSETPNLIDSETIEIVVDGDNIEFNYIGDTGTVISVNSSAVGAAADFVDSATIEVVETAGEIELNYIGPTGGGPSWLGQARYVLVDPAQGSAADDLDFTTPFVSIEGALDALQDYYDTLATADPTEYELTKGTVVYIAAGLYDESITWTYTDVGKITFEGLVPITEDLPNETTTTAEQLAYGAAVVRGIWDMTDADVTFKNIYFRYPTSVATNPLLTVTKANFIDCWSVIRRAADGDTSVAVTSVNILLTAYSTVKLERCYFFNLRTDVIRGNDTPIDHDNDGGVKTDDLIRCDLTAIDCFFSADTLSTSKKPYLNSTVAFGSGYSINIDDSDEGLQSFLNCTLIGPLKSSVTYIVTPEFYRSSRRGIHLDNCIVQVLRTFGTSSLFYSGTFSVKNSSIYQRDNVDLATSNVVIYESFNNVFIEDDQYETWTNRDVSSIVKRGRLALDETRKRKNLLIPIQSVVFPASDYASLTTITIDSISYNCIQFATGVDQSAIFSFIMPNDVLGAYLWTEGIRLVFVYKRSSTTFSKIKFAVSGVIAIGSLDTTYSTPTTYLTTNTTLPLENLGIEIPFAYDVGLIGPIAAANYSSLWASFRITRLGSHEEDTNSGSVNILGMNLEYESTEGNPNIF